VLLDADCPSFSDHGTLYLGGPQVPGMGCTASGGSGPQITITHTTASIGQAGDSSRSGCTHIWVNGLQVVVGPCASADVVAGGLTTWTIPALRVQVAAVTADNSYTGTRTDTEVGKILHTIRRPTPSEVTTRSALRMMLTLSHVTAEAGRPIKGTASFLNTTTEDITVDTCAANGWLDVGLVGHGASFTPLHTLIGCAPTVQLRVGTTTFPITVSTDYSQCVDAGETGRMAATLPTCLSTGAPPLPTGKYRTTVVTVGLPPDTMGPDVLSVAVTR